VLARPPCIGRRYSAKHWCCKERLWLLPCLGTRAWCFVVVGWHRVWCSYCPVLVAQGCRIFFQKKVVHEFESIANGLLLQVTVALTSIVMQAPRCPWRRSFPNDFSLKKPSFIWILHGPKPSRAEFSGRAFPWWNSSMWACHGENRNQPWWYSLPVERWWSKTKGTKLAPELWI
jgi:hypothetical protein